jgi:glycosyltransferase involved in cell wall biosynthesis
VQLSVVIICKDGGPGLEQALQSVQGLGGEILVYDSGSSDNSKQIAAGYGAKILSGTWEGYGRNRWKAVQLATYDWILMLDTDEAIDEILKESISRIDLEKRNVVYNLRYKNYFGNKWLRHGEWGNDSHIRLGNRIGVKTDGEVVHEKLFLQPGIEIKTLTGFVLHHTAKNAKDFAGKMMLYANLSAEKYLRQGKKAGFLNLFFSPVFSFIQNYFFKLGFLDGWQGYSCAKIMAWYSFLKYARLKELLEQQKSE